MDYISIEVDKIMKQFESPKNYAMAASWVIANYKGLNLKIINAQNSSSLADFFIIGSATNSTQAQAIAEEVSRQFKKHKNIPRSIEGKEEAQWILIDAGDVIVHVFQETAREIYNLDGLWAEYPTLEIPPEYYYGPSPEKKDESLDDYF